MSAAPNSVATPGPEEGAHWCTSCNVWIPASERAVHYASEWHRYNVKRKVAELPPVPKELFEAKLAELRAAKEESNRRYVCPVSGRVFRSAKALAEHQKSRKYQKKAEAASERASRRESMRSSSAAAAAEVSLGADGNALQHESAIIDEEEEGDDSMRYMDGADVGHKDDHDFFEAAARMKLGPLAREQEAAEADERRRARRGGGNVEVHDGDDNDDEHDDDVQMTHGADTLAPDDEGNFPGAIELGRCLFSGKDFGAENLEALLEHMRVKYGFFIPFVENIVDLEGLLIYAGRKIGVGHECLWCHQVFSSRAACRQHMIDSGHCKIRMETDDDEDEWEEFYDFSPKDEEKTQGDDHDDDDDDEEEESPVAGLTDLDELVLTNGTVIGHRSMQRYYGQHLRPLPPPTRNDRVIASLVSEYRRLALPGYNPRNTKGTVPKKWTEHLSKFDVDRGVRQNRLRMRWYRKAE
jgi:pre-60S factor REI1